MILFSFQMKSFRLTTAWRATERASTFPCADAMRRHARVSARFVIGYGILYSIQSV